MSRKSSVIALVSVLAGAALAVPAHHYDMGPVGRFSPMAGPELHRIAFQNGFEIDTRIDGDPELPPELTVESNGGSQHSIVQFKGPIDRHWVKQLEREGITTFGYLAHYAVLARLDARQRAWVGELPFVNWVGLFQPAYKLQGRLLDRAGTLKVTALVMPGQDELALVAVLGGRGVEQVHVSRFGTTVTATIDAAQLPAIARLDEVAWIQEWSEPTTANDNCQWVTQTGWRSGIPSDSLARNVWRNGVRGQGVVMSTTDTGLNTGHDMFRDPSLAITPPGVWPEHRKVVAYKSYGTADASEGQYHGSHVNGTVAGSDSANSGSSSYDGMSIDGRLYFVDLTRGSQFVLGEDLTSLWDTVYAGRGLPDSLRPIKQHSGSWRYWNSNGTYLLQDASTDAFIWENPDFLNLIAAGNEGSRGPMTCGNPSLAKNIITVGATENGTIANQIASFSSRGPSQDNRIKPTVMAPGVDLWSAQRTGTSGYSQMSGTSMATPATNGTIGLLRCYLQEGYYPTGVAEPGNRLGYNSAALLKAMAVASADPNVGGYTVPSFDIGWGRIDADSVLYFAGEQRKLILLDDTVGLATGEFKERQFRVNSSIPLRVALVWSDTAAAPNANPTLVNDLNLELIAPGGTEYRGNLYAGGQSTPNPGTWDAVNVEECARVNAPDTGFWTIWVGAQNVATARNQGFAWAITGDVEIAALGHDVGVRAIIAPSGQIDSGVVVLPRALIVNTGAAPENFNVEFLIDGSYADTQSVMLAAGASDTIDFAGWAAHPVGWHSARVTTLLSGDENPANDMMADSFQVVPLSGVEEGASLPRVFELGRPAPNPFTGRTELSFALPRSVPVRMAVYSVAGELVRILVATPQSAGHHRAAWDGTDAGGLRVSRGVYYVRFDAGDYRSSAKLILR